MRKALLVVSLLIVVSLVLACSPATTPAPSPTATKPAPSASPPPSSPTAKPSPSPTPTAGAPKYGGTLTFPLVIFPVSWDVHMKPTFSPFVGIPVFNNLVRFDATKPDIIPQNIIGDLAERWEVSPDGKVYTFYLVKGIKWHDGVAFTSEDVVYSLKKLTDPKRSLISTNFPAFDRAEAVDATTVKIYLKNASPSFFTQLAGPYAIIQSAHLATVDPKSEAFIVGTGAYKLKKVTSGLSIELQRNPDYFKKDAAGNKLPYLDGITMVAMTDRSAQADAFTTKRLDMMTPGPGITQQEQLVTIQQRAQGAVVQLMKPPFNNNLLFLNFKSKPLQDVRVRQALALLADPRQGITAAYGDAQWGNYDLAYFTPPYGIPTAEINKATQWDQPFDARVTQAKKLMADAGYASGFPMKMIYTQNVDYQKRIVWLADVWRRNLNIVPDTTSYDNVTVASMRTSGQFDAAGIDTLSLLGDPDEIMGFYVTGSAANFCGYSNPASDKLWAQQSQTVDLNQRIALTQQLERSLLTDIPAITFPFTNYGNAWWPYVKGFVLQNGSYMPNIAFERTWLDK